jgi:hypothetical protein
MLNKKTILSAANLIIIAIMILHLALIISCSRPVKNIESGKVEYSITLELIILAVNRNQTRITLSVAELNEAGNEIINEGTVGLPKDCPVFRLEDSQEKSTGCDDLAVGQAVTATLGALRDSYPWYSLANKIVITTPGAVESNTPMSTRLVPQFLGVIAKVTEVQAYRTTYSALTIEVLESSKYPEAKIIQPVLGRRMLVWRYQNGQYHLGDSDDYKPGQKVLILLERNWSIVNSMNEIEGVILEAIIFVE